MEGFKVDVDLEAAQETVQAFLTEEFGEGHQLVRLAPLAAGACQENYVVEVLPEGRTVPDRWVLRSDAAESLPGSITRQVEFEVVQTAVKAGVPTPAVCGLRQGLLRDEAWSYLMEWVEGDSVARRVLRGEHLAVARKRLPEQLAETLARIHRLGPEQAALPFARSSFSIDDAIEEQRRSLQGLPESHPALDLALRWLQVHRGRAEDGETVLVHGDYRLGNFMVDPDGLVAVLDWEFSRWGRPEEDVAWMSVRDWRFGQLDRPMAGLSRRQVFYEAYRRHSGRELDLDALHYWEVFGNVRWAIGAVMQGQRYVGGGETDLELLAIGRRAAEMEYEALRLIEVGVEDLKRGM